MVCYFKVVFPLNIEGFVYEYDGEIEKGVRVEVNLRGEEKIGIVWEKVENPQFKTKKIRKVIDKEPLIEEGLMKSIQFTSSYYNAPLGMVVKSAFPKKLFQKINIDVENDTKIVWGKGGKLSKEQEEAYHEISSCIKNPIFQSFLLFDAGGGKTELCLKLVEYVLENGGSALVLVPEIFFISHFFKLFTGRFGKKVVAVNHSRLTPKERFDVWCRARKGTIKVLIGTRSSVFVPLKNMKFIIIDNEQDESYKQEVAPLYNARDVAVVRAKNSNIPIMLVSSTPSLESLYGAKNGECRLFEFKRCSKDMPQINVVSLKKGEPITSLAKREIRNTLHRKKGVIVLVSGMGMEKVHNTLQDSFPQAHIVRVDSDTTRKKKDFQRILKEIEKADIIVGTQMVKGCELPHINLTVVASFEALLSSPDVRATEKAVSLIIQMANKGNVIVQSLNPLNPLFEYVKKYDWRTFAEEELKNRRALLYPPFTHLIRFIFQGRRERKLTEQAQRFTALLREKMEGEIVYGPVKTPTYMIKNEYRYHVLIKTRNVKNTLKKINEIKKEIENIKTICDVDPMNFL